MKKLLLAIVIVITGITSLSAQSTTTSFNIDGIKVIFKPTEKNVINVRLYYRGGVTNYPATQAGIEDLALEATSQCGTKKYQANAFRDTLDKYGISIYGTSDYDYGYIQLNCIKKYFNNGWDLFSDAVINPAFDDGQMDLLKTRMISNIKNYNSNNNIHELQMKSAFANTPYAINPIGTEPTITRITTDDVKKYYNSLLNKSRMFIVVVGNITKDELYEKILNSFGGVINEPYVVKELTAPVFADNKLASEQQDLKINYVAATMNAPEFTSPDYVPFRIAISGLGGNIYMYLRSIKSLSSDPTASTYSLRMPFAVMSASSTNPQQVMISMMGILKDVQSRGYNDEWLQHIKNTYITNNYVNDQSAAAITNSLGQAEILGNWQYADDLPQLVNMVTLDQVNKVINYYIKGVTWSYLGNVSAIDGFTPPVY